jgi:hypothetical protein
MHYVFLVLAALLRLVPHAWNITPIGSIGLFAGSYCDRRIAWLMPLIPLFIGDLISGFYDPLIMLFVYTGIAASALIGRWFLSKQKSLFRFAGAISVSAIIFYLLSNFPVWWVYYPRTIAGLAECYIKGIPYLGYSMMGDSLFVALIFGTHHLAQKFLGGSHVKQSA